MAPPIETETATASSPLTLQTRQSTQETAADIAIVKNTPGQFPRPPVFEDKYKEREYLKGRLAAAFRIFGKNGYDEGTASSPSLPFPSPRE